MAAEKRSRGYITRSKVSPPELPSFFVSRARIVARFQSPRRGRLVKLSAPAGFGKTLAMAQLAQCCRDEGLAVLWLSLDSADNDISRFLQTFLAAIRELPGDGGPVIEHDSNASIADGIMAFFDALTRPIAVFMDGFDSLENNTVRDLVVRGIESVPKGSVVVIGTRVEPEWGMSGFRANAQLTEIGVNALRFSREEVSQLLHDKLGTQWGTEHLDALHLQTEGWPTALWFAWLAISDGRDVNEVLKDISGGGPTLERFIADEVLAMASAEVRTFLLQTSPVDDIDRDIARELSPGADVTSCLAESERLNLMLRYYDGGEQVFRLNSLLRDSLYTRFRQTASAEVVAEAHSRACDYFIRRGRYAPAIRQAISAGRYDTATVLLREQLYPLLARGRMRFLAEVFEQLAAAGELNDSLHVVLHAWCVNFTQGPSVAYDMISSLDDRGMGEEARDSLLALRPMILAMQDQVAEAEAASRAALDQITGRYPYASAMLYQVNCQTNIILGHHDAARKAVNLARDAAVNGSGAFGIVLAESAEVMLDMMSGRLLQAATRVQIAEEGFRKSRMHPGHGIAISSVFHAEALYESGKLAEARALLERNISMMRDIGPPDALITAHTLMSRLAHRAGEFDTALEILTQLEADGFRLKLPRVIASAKLELANLRIQLEDYPGAAAKLEEAQQVYDWSDSERQWWVANDTLYPALINARLLLRRGRAAVAIADLKEELKGAERSGRERRVLKLRILLAEAQFLTGEKRAALRTMLRAVRFAIREGFISTFQEEGAIANSLYSEAQKSLEEELGSVEVDELPAGPASPYINHMGEKFTPKELAVLQHLAKGLSNAQMAAAMFVSESTVRSHLRSINVKLKAKNRTQALVMARELGIVS
ncbi:LuxR C-terminal-related transcriptional regulator [Spongiibacter taiwanensis]|uniref:LuxR C-terminal-related transcriptional regulator n=1 Tax=Spongiibacter taiwanensis TaxID=1748242 RepID=UPI002034E13D|nr:LuxR C-terminal-related transcriptional regulator [Spongiibacter taiwanensis]USA42611.1 LuxR C-terminal-related transcriptional regulator [Spongiibacter taiwanensis]